MIYNILNGDSLAYSFSDTKIAGEVIVFREGLIDGELSGSNLDDFWHTRAKYIGIPEEEYQDKVVNEFEKIKNAPENSEFNLWFEYDLFCQVNMWFVISVINHLTIQKKVFAVYTSYLDKSDKHFWNGFGPAKTNELKVCFKHRIQFADIDLQFGQDLWDAYNKSKLNDLKRLSTNHFACFPHIQEVIEAHIDRFPKEGENGRPERVLKEIINTISPDFDVVMQEFWNREGIYGFGDTQLKRLYDKVMQNR